MLRRIFLVLFCLGLCTCFAVALLPQAAPPGRFHIDKMLHIGAFAALTFLGMGAVRPRRLWPLVLIGLFAFGGTIEVAQWLEGGGRRASAVDLAADCLGVGVGFWFFYLLSVCVRAGFPTRLLSGIKIIHTPLR